MSVRASSAEWRVTCSTCGARKEFTRSVTFQTVVRMIKAVGWKIWNSSGIWQHKCPACVAKRLPDQRYYERLQA